MKAEQIHIALKQNQQIFKLTLLGDLIDSKKVLGNSINSINFSIKKLTDADAQVEAKKLLLKEAKTQANDEIKAAGNFRSQAQSAINKAEQAAKEIGVEIGRAHV